MKKISLLLLLILIWTQTSYSYFKESEQLKIEIKSNWNYYLLDNSNLDKYNDEYKKILILYYSIKWISVDEESYKKDLENLELVKNKLFWDKLELSIEDKLLLIMFFQLNNNTNNAYINSFVWTNNLEKQDLILEKLNEHLWNNWWVSWYIEFKDEKIIWKSWRMEQVKNLVLYKLNPYEKRSVFIDKNLMNKVCLDLKIEICNFKNFENVLKEKLRLQYKENWIDFTKRFLDWGDIKIWYDNSWLDFDVTEDNVYNTNLNFMEEAFIYENWFIKAKNARWFIEIVKSHKLYDLIHYEILGIPTIYRSYKSKDTYIPTNINLNEILDFKYR